MLHGLAIGLAAGTCSFFSLLFVHLPFSPSLVIARMNPEMIGWMDLCGALCMLVLGPSVTLTVRIFVP